MHFDLLFGNSSAVSGERKGHFTPAAVKISRRGDEPFGRPRQRVIQNCSGSAFFCPRRCRKIVPCLRLLDPCAPALDQQDENNNEQNACRSPDNRCRVHRASFPLRCGVAVAHREWPLHKKAALTLHAYYKYCVAARLSCFGRLACLNPALTSHTGATALH